MANNRMWLVCPVVGPNTHPDPAVFCLAKASTKWYAVNHSTEDALNAFLDEHTDCGYATDGPYPAGTTIHWKLEFEETE